MSCTVPNFINKPKRSLTNFFYYLIIFTNNLFRNHHFKFLYKNLKYFKIDLLKINKNIHNFKDKINDKI